MVPMWAKQLVFRDNEFSKFWLKIGEFVQENGKLVYRRSRWRREGKGQGSWRGTELKKL